MLRSLALGIVLDLLACSAAAAAEEGWKPEYYNPTPLVGDFLLPLPCGGQMAFRRIDTPGRNDWLDDLPVDIGQADTSSGYSEFIRRDFLVGSLTGGGPGDRFYYLGKYEVTKDQYAAVMEQACPQPKLLGREPAVNVSWFAAVDYARHLDEWLLANKPDALPRVQQVHVHLRLPTEVEWEYAARGGAKVSEQDFRQRLFPMDGLLVEYAVFQGAGSSAGEIALAGKTKPNPLGLFDMLGNAEEFVFEPYTLNRVGRRHGQAGGFMTKGGSFRTPEGQIHTAARTEYSYFDERTGKATALDTFGFRLAISAPVSGSLARLDEIEASWSRIYQSRPEQAGFDPVKELQEIEKDTANPGQRQALGLVREKLISELALRNDVENRTVRSAIFNGAVLIRNYRDDQREIDRLTRGLDLARQSGITENIKRSEQALEDGKRRRGLTYEVYLAQLVQSANDYSTQQHAEQLDALKRQLAQRQGLKPAERFAELYVMQITAYKKDRVTDESKLGRQILDFQP